MEQSFGICKLSSAPLRCEPADRSEMISQLLFGDHFEVLELAGKWVRIRMAYDGYEGWMDPKQAMTIDGELFDKLSFSADILGLEVCHSVVRTDVGELLYLLPGSSLPELQDRQFRINDAVFQLKTTAVKPDLKGFKTGIEQAAMFYLNAPYLWGGRSPFGIDCSGFSQIVFKQFSIRLKRDAWQQALQGDLVGFLQEARAGDLAFFDNDEGRITHVGIMLGNDKIIHASGHVRVDPIDDQGIFNRELNRYTHKLRVIKRFVS
ncbi:MAG TPA: C40 family peptidase [Sphingobacteriaceae bacterium]